MVVNERHEASTELLILNAALAGLADEAELKSTKAAEVERMAAAVAGAIPAYWEEISAKLPQMKKRGQNAVVQALLGRKPPITDVEIFTYATRQMHQLDHHVRAGLIARLARLGAGAEASRQMILLLQIFEKESSFRPSQLSKVDVADLGVLHRLLVQRASELMLFPRAMLRISLDWTVRLQGSTVDRRALISQMPRLLAKLKWRDISDTLLQPYFTTIADMGEGAGMLYRTQEWGLLFKFILKHLRTRPTARTVLLELGRLLAACRAELVPQEETAAPKVNRVTYDPQSGAAWSSVPIYPPHVKSRPAADVSANENDAADAGGEAVADAPETPNTPAARAAILARLRPRTEPQPKAEAEEENEVESQAEIETEAQADEEEPTPATVETDETEELEELLGDGKKRLLGLKKQSEQSTARLADLRGRIAALQEELSEAETARQNILDEAREVEETIQSLKERLGQDAGAEDESRISA